MLKYLDVKETFSEVPNEISLCISLSGCSIHCEGCHSPELWSDRGVPLTPKALLEIVRDHKGITCVCILGGEDISELNTLLKCIKTEGLLTCWYTGQDSIPKGVNLSYLDYIKIGHFNGHPITDRETNQRMIRISTETRGDKIVKFNKLEDITHVFWDN